MPELQFFDSTLRDGSHAIKHQLTPDKVNNYCSKIDSVGLNTVIVGHGNGLGASSLQVGLSLHTDHELLSAAKASLHKTKLGAYMIPGFGTIKDNLIPAIDDGVDLFCIGCHCTEANITRQHIEFLREKGKEAYGILMMYHLASTERILEEAQKMESYGANGVILMDSAGASTPELVKKTISTLYNNLKIKVGFHAHNNLGLAVANSYTAIQEGASIIDGTLRGFGAGAGNCQIEALLALLIKEKYDLKLDFYKLIDTSLLVMPSIMEKDMGIDPISIISGMAGVFSGFKIHVLKAAEKFNVNPCEIFLELGRRKAVAGQEDMIVEIASQLAYIKNINQAFSF